MTCPRGERPGPGHLRSCRGLAARARLPGAALQAWCAGPGLSAGGASGGASGPGLARASVPAVLSWGPLLCSGSSHRSRAEMPYWAAS